MRGIALIIFMQFFYILHNSIFAYILFRSTNTNIDNISHCYKSCTLGTKSSMKKIRQILCRQNRMCQNDKNYKKKTLNCFIYKNSSKNYYFIWLTAILLSKFTDALIENIVIWTVRASHKKLHRSFIYIYIVIRLYSYCTCNSIYT